MGGAEVLALKLLLTPLLVGGASLIARRWGSAVGGWVVGIPFTSGPVTLFIALSHGAHFAAAVATGIMAGTASQVAFALGYSWCARRWGWRVCLAVATVAFGVLTGALLGFSTGPLVTFAFAMASISVAFAILPRPRAFTPARNALPAWDIPARMLVATCLVIALTEGAALLGPRLAGLLAPFPLYAALLSVFSHRLNGAEPAIAVWRGLLLGLFAFAGFFLALALLLEQLGVAVAFTIAVVVAVAVQLLSLAVGRRLRIA